MQKKAYSIRFNDKGFKQDLNIYDIWDAKIPYVEIEHRFYLFIYLLGASYELPLIKSPSEMRNYMKKGGKRFIRQDLKENKMFS